MKKSKLVLLPIIAAVCVFVVVIYASCSKDKCKGISCQNGVTACIDGTCQCPTGYSGNFCELSSIVFLNNSYTPIYVTVSGYSGIIPVDSSLSFAGASGEGISVSAYTYGANAAGTAIGDTMYWTLNDNFPVNGVTRNDTFNVSATYFYLQIIDENSTNSIDSINVNFNIPGAQTPGNITIPNDGKAHGTGYYAAYPLTEVYAASSNGYHWVLTPTAISDTTLNELVTVTAN